MSKIIVLLLLTVGFISCKSSENKIDKLEIAKEYYKALDNSDDSAMAALLTDSLLTKESDYEQTFSRAEYMEWLRWDSVFEPTYETLKIEQEDEIVKARISKTDRRILFLHEDPIVTDQIIRFVDAKIISVETKDYVDFKEKTFLKNRSGLLSWIDKNHPELNGFINDQTEKGGLKYLKAIQLYENKE